MIERLEELAPTSASEPGLDPQGIGSNAVRITEEPEFLLREGDREAEAGSPGGLPSPGGTGAEGGGMLKLVRQLSHRIQEGDDLGNLADELYVQLSTAVIAEPTDLGVIGEVSAEEEGWPPPALLASTEAPASEGTIMARAASLTEALALPVGAGSSAGAGGELWPKAQEHAGLLPASRAASMEPEAPPLPAAAGPEPGGAGRHLGAAAELSEGAGTRAFVAAMLGLGGAAASAGSTAGGAVSPGWADASPVPVAKASAGVGDASRVAAAATAASVARPSSDGLLPHASRSYVQQLLFDLEREEGARAAGATALKGQCPAQRDEENTRYLP